VDKERVEHWIKLGAQPSDSVRTLIARHLTAVPAPAAGQPTSAAAAKEPAAATEP
jgi:ribosomal protein S16